MNALRFPGYSRPGPLQRHPHNWWRFLRARGRVHTGHHFMQAAYGDVGVFAGVAAFAKMHDEIKVDPGRPG
eukprot:4470762-Alexandrium_andersonii.AAC.1